MTELLDFPVTSAPVLPVHGESVLVPGTSLRLPLPPEVRGLDPDRVCRDCAGTGVEFDRGIGALRTCFCMEEPDPPVDDEPVIVVGPFDLDRMPSAVRYEYGPGRPVDPADLLWPRSRSRNPS